MSPKVQWKEVDEMVRGDLEEKAEFLGLIIMQNSVKVETFPAIKALHDADINTVMVTGRITYIKIISLSNYFYFIQLFFEYLNLL